MKAKSLFLTATFIAVAALQSETTLAQKPARAASEVSVGKIKCRVVGKFAYLNGSAKTSVKWTSAKVKIRLTALDEQTLDLIGGDKNFTIATNIELPKRLADAEKLSLEVNISGSVIYSDGKTGGVSGKGTCRK